MCNLVAILAHTRPGDEMICGHESHIYGVEAAGAAEAGAKLSGRRDGFAPRARPAWRYPR
ncbi:beta-eliminating lyase-related protein [Cupriavidus sp. CuC1]|uniref:beta-eliminating lyase-related protein n=1 Tax=Cupriavidus sp. CuC1 TaxID=3373131 RepID=UPI0037D04A28